MASLLELEDELATPVSVLELPVKELGPVGNRRTLPRLQARYEVHCDDGETLTGVDLSFGGMLCLSATPLWPGNVLQAKLLLPGEKQPIAIPGRAARSTAPT